jgi:H+-transporting ATPase
MMDFRGLEPFIQQRHDASGPNRASGHLCRPSYASSAVGNDGVRASNVTRLPAIEGIAGIDVLRSDKTGALTKGEVTAGDVFAVGSVERGQVFLDAALASRAEDRDPIDLAVLDRAGSEQLKSFQVMHFQPFDPVHKRTEATVKSSGDSVFKVRKGAPQVVLALDPGASEIQSQVEKAANEFASHGFCSLGVARTNGQGQWQLRGVIPLFDSLREDSKATVETARQMGIK